MLKRIKAGEMPPKEKPRPAEKEEQFLADWITGKAEAEMAARRGQGRVVLRRESGEQKAAPALSTPSRSYYIEP